MTKEYIDREALLQRMETRLKQLRAEFGNYDHYTDGFDEGCVAVEDADATDAVEVDKVAEMLRNMFNDDCACNYNGNDEWLTVKCKYAETDCPMPKERLGCWKEFVKHFLAKMDGERKEV